MILEDYAPAQLENRAAHAALLRYVDAVRMHGHRAAHVDPLDMIKPETLSELDPSYYGLTDLEHKFLIDGIVWTNAADPNLPSSEVWSLERIVSHLRAVYVGNIAYEYMHSPSKTERLWFSHILESSAVAPQNVRRPEEKRRIWELMTRSEVLDQFLQVKFPNLKRYGLEGGESMLPALDTLFSVASEAGIEHIVLAMPHRGRLNLLTDLLEFPPAALFHKVKGGSELPEKLGYSGDVISHLFASPKLHYGDPSRLLRVFLLPNPSHLEAVNPVALGMARGKQTSVLRDSDSNAIPSDKVMCVQLHGDASFVGQGVVMESLGLSNLPHFTCGGTIHLVVNNNIGFTTSPSNARSSPYCSDIGKMINAPAIHVNGDYPEDVCRAMDIAFRYRDAFRKDIIVDLQVYRRWGHNELDDPSFTQSLMYQRIGNRRSIPALYEEKLLSEGILRQADVSQLRNSYKDVLEVDLQKGCFTPVSTNFQEAFKQMVLPISEAIRDPETGIEEEDLRRIGRASLSVPESFEIHPRLKQHIDARLVSIESGKEIDWSTAEAMAFGSLMLGGYDVRLSGQDSVRGTFTQRHGIFIDQKTENTWVPLNAGLDSKGVIEFVDSSLSENAVLGFEYGMSWETPKLLPIWEAQFGDFFNGAQVIFDTFISSAETKWMMQSGIVVLLPHGLEGGGPEHSSMRIERILQLTNDPCEYHEGDAAAKINMHVAYPSTPAQYFHLLRRQMRRNYRRPVIVASPKGLLRLPAAASSFDEFGPGTRFRPVFDDLTISDPTSVKRIIILSGKIYYELAKERATIGLQDSNAVALVRIEELSPFPYKALADILRRYQNADEWCFVQEEPRNQGTWTHVHPRLLEVQRNVGGRSVSVKYIGRKEDAVPAVGVTKVYQEQQDAVLREAFADQGAGHSARVTGSTPSAKSGLWLYLKSLFL